jgi:hypothetical protein
MRILLSPSSAGIDVGSIVVLPELIGNDLDPGNYMREVRALAMELRAWVVGGRILTQMVLIPSTAVWWWTRRAT